MCTALTLVKKDGEHLFGRNMDIEYEFGQSVGIIPRNYKYLNKSTNKVERVKNAIVGMMTIIENHPMLCDGLNEKGLAIAGLNFPNYCKWEDKLVKDKYNIPGYDFMLWVLSNFDTIEDLKKETLNVNIMNTQIREQTPSPTLHWIATDLTGESIVIEKTADSFKVFENHVGVLGNSPTFDWHMTNLSQYIRLVPEQKTEATWSHEVLLAHGQGVGAFGLPGDWTPASRFVRTVFLRHNALLNEPDMMTEMDVFHILNNVAMIRGSVRTPENLSDITQYTSCMNQEKGLYFYTTYKNSFINVINMYNEDLDGPDIKLFPYNESFTVNYQN